MKHLTTDIFIEKAKEVHGNKYDYSKVNYVNSRTKICVICPKHGEFYITPSSHIYGKSGCPVCVNNIKYTTEEFIKKARDIHGDKYDYSKVDYNGAHKKICIICPEHGQFWIKPNTHISQQQGCYKCSTRYMDNDKFIEKAKLIHGDKYDYSKVKYVNNHTKICIICPEHGQFWQTPNDHLKGCGCPICNESKMELYLANILTNNNIKFERQKTFKWLKLKRNLYLDFYLPDYNIAIECQGEQHFKPIKYFGGYKFFKKRQLRDKEKHNLCKDNNIKIYYAVNKIYNNEKINNVNVFDYLKLLDKIEELTPINFDFSYTNDKGIDVNEKFK